MDRSDIVVSLVAIALIISALSYEFGLTSLSVAFGIITMGLVAYWGLGLSDG